MKRHLLAALILLTAASAANVHGQSPNDGFNPFPNFPVYAVVVQPDGKVLIGGEFTRVSQSNFLDPNN